MSSFPSAPLDRGPESPEVVRFFRERPNSYVIVGNFTSASTSVASSRTRRRSRACKFGSGYAEAVRWMGSLPYFLELG